MKILSLIALLFISFEFNAQVIDSKLRGDMAFYGDIVMNTAASAHRARANDSLTACLDRFLASPNSFSQSLEKVPWLTIVQDTQATFRLITWQLNRADSIFTYFGRLQIASGQVYALMDDKSTTEPLYTKGDPTSWYGAKYGKLVEFQRGGEIAYLLFGFNAHSKWNRQKVVDVLYFDNGMPSFGMPVFINEGQDAERHGRYRILLTYSAEVRANLEYHDAKGMIIHDHLIAMQERFPGQGATFVSDGSYEAYKINENGNWVYRAKLYDDDNAEPLDDGQNRSKEVKKDLFGRVRQ